MFRLLFSISFFLFVISAEPANARTMYNQYENPSGILVSISQTVCNRNAVQYEGLLKPFSFQNPKQNIIPSFDFNIGYWYSPYSVSLLLGNTYSSIKAIPSVNDSIGIDVSGFFYGGLTGRYSFLQARYFETQVAFSFGWGSYDVSVGRNLFTERESISTDELINGAYSKQLLDQTVSAFFISPQLNVLFRIPSSFWKQNYYLSSSWYDESESAICLGLSISYKKFWYSSERVEYPVDFLGNIMIGVLVEYKIVL